jgi:hypothetical protein
MFIRRVICLLFLSNIKAIHSKPDYMTLKSGQLLSRLYALKTHY